MGIPALQSFKPPEDIRALMIATPRYRGHSYGRNHPLGIPRVALLIDLLNSYDALEQNECLCARPATRDELTWFHRDDYIDAVFECQQRGKIPGAYRKKYAIGNFENPWFDQFFTIPAIATGASIQSAEAVISGKMAFNPAGGMHHAMPAKARGFCFFNDAVIGILRLRQNGLRVLYIDMDAHHGDGVEFAFRNDPDVFTCSFHMDTAYSYPFQGGGVSNTGRLGNAMNLPLPKETCDSEYRYACRRLWPHVVAAFKPDALVLQAGTDILLPDPLGKFNISNRFFIEAVELAVELSPKHADGLPKLMVLGGGGYQPITLARCWSGVWGVLSGRRLPDAIPPAGKKILENVNWDDDEDEPYFKKMFECLWDDPLDGAVRADVKDRVCSLKKNHPLFL